MDTWRDGIEKPDSIVRCVGMAAKYLDSNEDILRERSVNALGRIGRADFALIEPYWSDMFSLAVDKVYPESIIEKRQSGDIFVDDLSDPQVILFWHYSGFAYIAGKPDLSFITEIVELMKNPRENHSDRLALQTGNDDGIRKFLLSCEQVKAKKQYLFDFKGKKQVNMSLKKEFNIEKINFDNYNLISGNITPAFSWESETAFLKNGFGYVVSYNNTFVACAFSAGISEKYVDIGIETSKEFRGQGFAKIAAFTMIEEIQREGKIPVWECNTTNEASMKLALSLGFEIKGTHPLYIISK